MTDATARALETALDGIDRIKQRRKRSVILAACFEVVLIGCIIWAIDFSDSLHLLVLFCSCFIYGMLAFITKFFIDEVNIGIQQILDALKPVDEMPGTES